MNTTTDLYNHLNRICNPITNWRNENITIRSLEKLININLDKFFSASDEYGKKEKLEILLNFRQRIIKEFFFFKKEFCFFKYEEVLALAVSGIAHEVFKEGKHTLHKPAEIMDQIAYNIISQNLKSLDKIFIKDTYDLLITEKFTKNLDNAVMRFLEENNYSLKYFGIEDVSEAIDFVIDHKDQLSIANLKQYEGLRDFHLEKLRLGCPYLKGLDLSYCFEWFIYDRSSMVNSLGKMTSLKFLNLTNSLNTIRQKDLIFVLRKLTSLKHLILDSYQPYNISVGILLAIENMNELETLVLPKYDHNEDKINHLVLALEKLPSFKLILSSDEILREKLTAKFKTTIKVDKVEQSTFFPYECIVKSFTNQS